MAVAKIPGAGQGRGGGRPRREGEVKEIQLRLSPRAVELLHAAARAGNVPAWQIVERAILAGVSGASQLPPEALEMAREAAAFLESQEDRPAAVEALHRAWEQALALAHHDLAPTPDQG